MKRMSSTNRNSELLREPQKDERPSGTARVEVNYSPFAFLRIPAIILGCIGVLGILIDNVEMVSVKFSFLNIPPEWLCYVIAAIALVLFGVSLTCPQSKKEVMFRKMTPTSLPENWRSI